MHRRYLLIAFVLLFMLSAAGITGIAKGAPEVQPALNHAGLGGRGVAQVGPSPSPAAPVSLPGHVPAILGQATRLALAPQTAADQLTLTVVLNRDDPAGFAGFEAGVHDPRSPLFQHFAGQDDQTSRFGPSLQHYNAVLDFLQGEGFSLVAGSSNRLTLTVAGTRTQAEHAFGVHIDDYRLGNRSFHSNDRDPLVPPSVAPLIQAVIGLSNLAQPVPLNVSGPASAAAPDVAPSPGSPVSLATAYNFGSVGTGINGAGQKIGLPEFDNFSRTDVSNWLALAHLPASLINQLTTVDVDGGTTASNGSGTTEVLLDVATEMGLAQGASYVVYDTPSGKTSFQTLFNAMISGGDTVISNSWGYCENQTTLADVTSLDAILAAATASGISVFNASDDTGNSCGGSGGVAQVPADAPHGTAVGGTNLQVGANGVYLGESWWNDATGAGGYAVSSDFTVPAYQAAFTGGTQRSIPDVVADADPSSGIELCQAVSTNTGLTGGCPDTLNGLPALHGGTSMAAPEWAAGIALINQKQGHLTGNLNLALYTHASSAAFHAALGMSSDFAHVGLGSFDLGNLAAALIGSPINSVSTAPGTVQQQLPANGMGGQSSTPTLSWNAPFLAVSGVTTYTVSLRTSNGTALAGLASTTSTSASVPAGENLQAGQTYQWNVVACNGSACSSPNATWFSFTTAAPAALTSPAPGSTLGGSTVAFSWSGVSGANQYVVWIGSAPGNYDLFWGSNGTATSVTATGLPVDGRTLYIQLWTYFSFGWLSDGVHTYAALGPAVLSTPAPGSTLGGGNVTFSWTGVSGAQQYVLWVGTASGKSDLFWGSNGTGTSVTATGLPTDGRTLYVQLWTYFSFGWLSDGVHTYTAATQPPAALTSPASGSTLSSASAQFSWSGVSGADQYVLWIGTAAGKYDLFWGSNGTGTSVTATGLPTNGSKLYIQLWTHFPASGWASDGVHTYTALLAAALTSPAPGTQLAGSTVQFSWSGVTGADQYVLWVGTAPGKSDLFWGSNGTATSVTATGLPADGRTLYVQVWTHFPATGWQSDGVHTYTAAG